MAQCTWDKKRKTWVIQGYKNGKKRSFTIQIKLKKGSNSATLNTING